MSEPGFEAEFDERAIAVRFEHANARARELASARNDAHPPIVGRRESVLEHSVRRSTLADHDRGEVAAAGGVAFEIGRDATRELLLQKKTDDARGVLIEALMHR